MLQLSTWTVDRKKGYGERSKIIFSLFLNSKMLDGYNVSPAFVKYVQNAMQRCLKIPYKCSLKKGLPSFHAQLTSTFLFIHSKELIPFWIVCCFNPSWDRESHHEKNFVCWKEHRKKKNKNLPSIFQHKACPFWCHILWLLIVTSNTQYLGHWTKYWFQKYVRCYQAATANSFIP